MPTGKIRHMHYATKNFVLIALSWLASATQGYANSACWSAASEGYGIPVSVLQAVAKTESGFNPDARNLNKNGTYDIGLMQINSGWLPNLAKYGITEESLKDACTNVKVGAWILSNNAKKMGWNWSAIGAYNVGCAKLGQTECDRRRNQYAWKIHTALNKVRDIDAPKHLLASYEQGATAISRKVILDSNTDNQPKKILIVNISEPQQQTVLIAAAEIPGEPRHLSVGGFLNYEEVGDDE